MAELVDALSSDGSGYAIRVRLSLSAPMKLKMPPFVEQYAIFGGYLFLILMYN